MWKLWLAAAVVGVAVLAAVLALGLRLGDSEAEPPPTTASVPRELTWADRASALCSVSLGTVRAALSSSSDAAETDEERLVRLFLETTAIEGRLVSNLRAIPVPAPDQAKADLAVGGLEEQWDRDVFVGRVLQRRFNSTLLRQSIDQYEREAARLSRLFEDLSADGCVRYLDPASYR
jgi:hypothetical protein